FAHVQQLGDQFAGALAFVDAEICVAQALAPRRTLAAQFLQSANTPLLACAARFHPTPNPGLFLREQLVELLVERFLDRELLGLARPIAAVVARISAEATTIELDHSIGNAIEKRAVVGDEQQCTVE